NISVPGFRKGKISRQMLAFTLLKALSSPVLIVSWSIENESVPLVSLVFSKLTVIFFSLFCTLLSPIFHERNVKNKLADTLIYLFA
ncbi:hypothetical protein AAAV47_12720, partial [Staphylococcus hominis]